MLACFLLSGPNMTVVSAKNTNRHLRRSQKGYSLVEVLIAAAIIGIMFTSIYAGIARSFDVTRATRENLRAIQMLQDRTEIIRLYTWTQLNTPGFVPTTFSDYFVPSAVSTNRGVQFNGTVTITNAPLSTSYAGDMKLVNITVSWTSGVNSYTQQVSTLVSHYGLQNYIYY
jgi:prepilin-type N-terminal cleavage/methylation domain-containing protein